VCIVAKHLTVYLQSTDLLLWLQSGFRPGHFIETATLRLLSDMVLTADLMHVWLTISMFLCIVCKFYMTV